MEEDTLVDPRREEERLTKAAVFANLFGKKEPPRVGRFVVLGQLGSGGMGVVYRAYDEQLRREVAVKVLQAHLGQDTGSRGRQRLLREAQAMAKISHPNVVPVFEVGEYEDDIFVAMELVDGGTLRDWLDAEARPWHDIVSMHLQAARGLAEAHAQGLVHRDFKPANVLVGAGPDGTSPRARVMDFGLSVPRSPEDSAPDLPRAGIAEHSDSRLTITGTILGTPAYMSPEQFDGAPADARSDQFSFCVALWEALYRARPFAGTSVHELGANVTAGALRTPDDTRDVPMVVLRALERGLRPDPDARYPDLSALIGELERALAPRRSVMFPIAVSAGAVVLGGAIAAAVFDGPVPEDDPGCAPASARVAGAWDDDIVQRLGAAFASADDALWVRGSWDYLRSTTDAWVDEWTQQYNALCEAEPPADAAAQLLHAQRNECLESALYGLRSRTEFLLDTPNLSRAAAGVLELRLSPLDACADDLAVARRMPMPADPEVRDAVTELRREATRLRRQVSRSNHEEGQVRVASLIERAAELDYPPVDAELEALRSSFRAYADPGGRESLLAALRAAERAEHDAVEFDVAMSLHAGLAGPGEFSGVPNPPDPEGDALRNQLLSRIEMLSQRSGATDGMRLAYETARSRSAIADGRPVDAIAILRAAIEDDVSSDPHLDAFLYLQLCRAQFLTGDPDSAIESCAQSVAIFDWLLGPGHPAASGAHERYAFTLMWVGRLPEAYEAFGALIERMRSGGDGPLTAPTAWATFERAMVQRTMGQPVEARRVFEEVEATLLEIEGPRSYSALRGPTLQLARTDLTRGNLEAARPRIEQLIDPRTAPEVRGFGLGLASELAARDGDHELAKRYLDELAEFIAVLGNTPKLMTGLELSRAVNAELRGDSEAALSHALLAATAVEEAKPTDATFPFPREARIMYGRQLVKAGRHAAAIEPLEKGLEGTFGDGLLQVTPYGPWGHFALAQALWESDGDREAARRHATRAAQGYRDIDSPYLADELREVQRWLAAHRPRRR